MVAPLKDLIPPAKSSSGTTDYDHTNEPWFEQRYSAAEPKKAVIKPNPVPPYLNRAGFKPHKLQDFGHGGAFPEILIAQFPLDMGRDFMAGCKTLLVTVDEHGNVSYDAIVKQNENSKKIVYSQHSDLIPAVIKDGLVKEDMDVDEKQKEIQETTESTKAALKKIINARLSAAQPKNVPTQSNDSKYIKYKPSQQSAAFNSGAKERVIKMVEEQVDPLEPSKFKYKKVPRASGSPPVPVLHSPPRPVTVKDQQDSKIPPCISNWKNPKGYTIPLDKRLAADGRGLQDVQINDNFTKLSESLHMAELKAREALEMRSKVQQEMMMKEKDKKEKELLELARRARREREEEPKERKEEREEMIKREKLREERSRERVRERRLEAKDAPSRKKSKTTRDRERDISEKVALGMANAGKGSEVQYDQRLFNQEKGMSSGFAQDDSYNIYDKGLHNAQTTLNTLYRPKKDVDSQVYGGADEQLDKIRKTERFKADKGFGGTSDRAGPRSGPVEFEKDAAVEADPFGLGQLMTRVQGSIEGSVAEYFLPIRQQSFARKPLYAL